MYRVMIVDDERLIREGLASLIDWSLQGFRVASLASDGVEALERLSQSPVELVVADIRMPRMDGLELLEALRRQGSTVKYLILSGFAEFEYARRASSLRIDGYLLKPVDENELILKLAEIHHQLDATPGARPQPDLAQQMLDLIEMRYAENLNLQAVADILRYRPDYLGKVFRTRTGESFSKALDRVRIRHAKELLGQGMKVHEVAAQVGYRYVDYFHQKFKQLTGLAPSRYH